MARRRTRVGEIGLAPGARSTTEHVFLDVDPRTRRGYRARRRSSGSRRRLRGDRGQRRLRGRLARARAAWSSERAARLGLPACAGHDLSGAYGLETRTVSAAINAAILPAIERTAALVEHGADREAGARRAAARPPRRRRRDGHRRLPPPPVVHGRLRPGRRRRRRAPSGRRLPTRSSSSAAARARTSPSSAAAGRVLRSIKVMGRPTAIRSIDSWVVGAAGGSMARLGRSGVSGIGPRSAHVAGLPMPASPCRLTSPVAGPRRSLRVRAIPTTTPSSQGPGGSVRAHRDLRRQRASASSRRAPTPPPPEIRRWPLSRRWASGTEAMVSRWPVPRSMPRSIRSR